MRVFTIGYESLLPGPLVEELELAGVQRVVDVRFRPQSRRPGMSKTRLGVLLAEHGIEYENARWLGTPPDIRHLYKSNRVAEAHAAFAAHIGADDALDAFAQELRGAPSTALLCLEADPAVCHRSVLTTELRARLPGLEVVDL